MHLHCKFINLNFSDKRRDSDKSNLLFLCKTFICVLWIELSFMNIHYAEGHRWRNVSRYVVLLKLRINCSSFSSLVSSAQPKIIKTTLSLQLDLLIALLKKKKKKTRLIMSSWVWICQSHSTFSVNFLKREDDIRLDQKLQLLHNKKKYIVTTTEKLKNIQQGF